MKPDLPKYKTSDEVDFVIVGSGAAGGIMAKELSSNGFRVVVLEQGLVVHGRVPASPGDLIVRFLGNLLHHGQFSLDELHDVAHGVSSGRKRTIRSPGTHRYLLWPSPFTPRVHQQ